MKQNRRSFLKNVAGMAAITALPLTSCARTTKRPNILFAISDDQSWWYAGAYGCNFVKTPAFDRVAQDGVLFTNVFAAAPQCSPDRAAILTGRHIWQLEEAGTHASNFPRKWKVFTEELEKSGYKTGYTGKPWGPGNWEITGWPHNPVGKAYQERKIAEKPAAGISSTDYAANFKDFMAERKANEPFCFWYGAFEPHRSYEWLSGQKAGKSIKDVTVPPFLPDDEIIRQDLLDFAVEIEWFDKHLGDILKTLEEHGELENTLVVVTSDNGMPFPRAKANLYEYGTHMPFAVMWPSVVKSGRTVDDLIGFIDLAPTFLEACNVPIPEMMTGKSFLNILKSNKSGIVDESRQFVMSGRERHTHARPNNWAYPSRSLRTHDFMYVWNVKPDRWPAGNPTGSGEPEGYHDIDGCPSKTFILEHQDEYPELAAASLAKRPEEELFDIQNDPACMNNVAGEPAFAEKLKEMRELLREQLTATGDPRISGSEIFESYPRYSRMRQFPGFKEQGEYNPEYQ